MTPAEEIAYYRNLLLYLWSNGERVQWKEYSPSFSEFLQRIEAMRGKS